MKQRLLAKRALTMFVVGALLAMFFIIPLPVAAQAASDQRTIVFDLSHGQTSSDPAVGILDQELDANLTAMGYTVIWAKGGINSTLLTNVDALILGSIYGATHGYTSAEFTAISTWFNTGHKFLWVGGDSDYGGYTYINDNMTHILQSAGSHVYLEPTAVEDPINNCGSGYRVVANKTSTDSFVAPIESGVTEVLMHGPTLVYGSNSNTPGPNVSPVALETTSITNVYPILYYGAAATIVDADVTPPIAHTDGQVGSFVAATIEVNVGTGSTGVIVVSGASPYGDYMPMYAQSYKDVPLDGYNLVKNAIDFSIQRVNPWPMNWMLILAIGAIGAVVVIVVVVAVMKKK